jgi:hypothetical protein
VVIEPALFERVQRRLEQNKRESQRKDRNPEFGMLRRGIARCGHCNSSLGVVYNGGKDVDGKRQPTAARRSSVSDTDVPAATSTS